MVVAHLPLMFQLFAKVNPHLFLSKFLPSMFSISDASTLCTRFRPNRRPPNKTNIAIVFSLTSTSKPLNRFWDPPPSRVDTSLLKNKEGNFFDKNKLNEKWFLQKVEISGQQPLFSLVTVVVLKVKTNSNWI